MNHFEPRQKCYPLGEGCVLDYLSYGRPFWHRKIGIARNLPKRQFLTLSERVVDGEYCNDRVAQDVIKVEAF